MSCAETWTEAMTGAKRTCQKPSTITEDGKDWCVAHAPSKRREADAKRRARWQWKKRVQDARVAIARQEHEVLTRAVHWTEHAVGLDELRRECEQLIERRTRLAAILAEHDATGNTNMNVDTGEIRDVAEIQKLPAKQRARWVPLTPQEHQLFKRMTPAERIAVKIRGLSAEQRAELGIPTPATKAVS